MSCVIACDNDDLAQIYEVSEGSKAVSLVNSRLSVGAHTPVKLHGGALLGVSLKFAVRSGAHGLSPGEHFNSTREEPLVCLLLACTACILSQTSLDTESVGVLRPCGLQLDKLALIVTSVHKNTTKPCRRADGAGTAVLFLDVAPVYGLGAGGAAVAGVGPGRDAVRAGV